MATQAIHRASSEHKPRKNNAAERSQAGYPQRNAIIFELCTNSSVSGIINVHQSVAGRIMRKFIVLVMGTALTSGAFAQEFRVPSVDDKRAKKVDVTFQTFLGASEDFEAFDGAEFEQDDYWGIGFGVAYNFTEHWALGFDFTWAEPDYDAVLFRRNSDGDLVRARVSTDADLITGQFKGIYNFSKKSFTPYAELGIGWTYYDTNVTTGDGFIVCNPFGFCRAFAETEDETNLSYGGGLGLRWEPKGRLLLKLSYNVLAVDFDGPSDDPLLQTIKFEIGSRY
jgi:opacity protein-like surface antigen